MFLRKTRIVFCVHVCVPKQRLERTHPIQLPAIALGREQVGGRALLYCFTLQVIFLKRSCTSFIILKKAGGKNCILRNKISMYFDEI